MKLHKLLLTAIAGSLLLTSCVGDDEIPTPPPSGAYADGVLILNQGGFQAGNSEVSFLSNDMELENTIFSAVNTTMTLGDTGQDMGLNGEFAYIVVNNSQKVEVVHRYTFEHHATITTGLNNPRYIAFSGDKAYVTNWGDGTSTSDDFVAVIDLNTNAVTSTIPVAEGPERIIAENGKLYVAHYGGYGYGNTVTVINAANNTIQTTIEVGDLPNSLEVADGKLYVMSAGMPSWAGTETFGQLDVINLATNAVANTLEFDAMHPSNLDIEGASLYYTAGSEIYKMDIAATSLPVAPLFTTTEQGAYGVYSFAVRNGHIYLGDAGDYNSNGKVYVHSLTGDLHNTYTVGVIPAGFYFN
jgi:YVTN family beta-propeller protein